jgi:hypothetical protein
MDPDMNKYELEHVVTGHEKMSRDEWQQAYRSAWDIFYTDEHLKTVIRRAYAKGINIRSLMPVLLWFSSAVKIENLHPLQWGIFRIKYRKDRRPGLPIEGILPFYAKYASDTVRRHITLAQRWLMLKRYCDEVEADPDAKSYHDEALIPVAEEDAEHMELYTQNDAARTAVARELRVAGVKPHTNGHHHDHAHSHEHHEEWHQETAPPPA